MLKTASVATFATSVATSVATTATFVATTNAMKTGNKSRRRKKVFCFCCVRTGGPRP